MHADGMEWLERWRRDRAAEAADQADRPERRRPAWSGPLAAALLVASALGWWAMTSGGPNLLRPTAPAGDGEGGGNGAGAGNALSEQGEEDVPGATAEEASPQPAAGQAAGAVPAPAPPSGSTAGPALAPPPGPAPPAPATPPAAAGPVVAPAARYADGVLSWRGRRWALGRPGDQVVTGDWDCDGEATPALLRPASGAVFRFDAWAQLGRALTVRVLERVPGAVALRAEPSSTGCDRLAVVRSDGSTRWLDPTRREQA